MTLSGKELENARALVSVGFFQDAIVAESERLWTLERLSILSATRDARESSYCRRSPGARSTRSGLDSMPVLGVVFE